ncbi:DUF308 domain-containing protein [Georgenia subflava]|uniref:WXG100 family type VII secretion target n=1 Tax=Georgenia subflava TaxID=1622177 RepID=A0A6N7EGD0_9MICO|nr:DUF308 domain-containing protein [Georgenia subflava]MPV37179.1 hypothetical protein [Georgenia subflava]
MTRPTDWSPLNMWDDPVPGDPEAVATGADSMVATASTISAAAENLRSIAASDGMTSKAVDKFRERANEVAAEIELAKDRYADTGTALNGYVPHLRHAQTWSETALENARDARTAMATASEDLAQHRRAGWNAEDDAARTRAEENADAAQTAYNAADGRLEAAFALLRTAANHRDEHAEIARGKIEDALEINDLDDSGWRQFLNKNAEFLDGVAKVLGAIGAVIAVVSLFVPGLNLLTIALVVGVGAAAINFALAENGNKGWGDFAWDVIGLATLGVGKIGALALRGVRASRATQVARNRASVLTPARPRGVPRRGRAGNRASRRRSRTGRERARQEYLDATTPPTTRNPFQSARQNVADNGWANVLRSGGGADAYQMSYYQRMAVQGQGGGQAADQLVRLQMLTGGWSNAEGAMSIYGTTGFANPVASWGGNVLDSMVGDQRQQDDVGGYLR